MKGVELLASIVGLLFLVVVSFVAGGIIIWTQNMVTLTGMGATYTLILSPFHEPIKYESMLLSYLELEHQGYAVKDIIVEAANQKLVSNIYIDGKYVTELPEFTRQKFGLWFGDNPYLLILYSEGEERVITGNKDAFIPSEKEKLMVRKVRMKIYSPVHDSELILYVK